MGKRITRRARQRLDEAKQEKLKALESRYGELTSGKHHNNWKEAAKVMDEILTIGPNPQEATLWWSSAANCFCEARRQRDAINAMNKSIEMAMKDGDIPMSMFARSCRAKSFIENSSDFIKSREERLRLALADVNTVLSWYDDARRSKDVAQEKYGGMCPLEAGDADNGLPTWIAQTLILRGNIGMGDPLRKTDGCETELRNAIDDFKRILEDERSYPTKYENYGSDMWVCAQEVKTKLLLCQIRLGEPANAFKKFLREFRRHDPATAVRSAGIQAGEAAVAGEMYPRCALPEVVWLYQGLGDIHSAYKACELVVKFQKQCPTATGNGSSAAAEISALIGEVKTSKNHIVNEARALLDNIAEYQEQLSRPVSDQLIPSGDTIMAGGSMSNTATMEKMSLSLREREQITKEMELAKSQHEGLCKLSASLKVYVCASCVKDEIALGAIFKQCARCRSARYCSTQCRDEHWPKHRLVCCHSSEPG